MTETSVLNLMCVECLEVLKGDTYRKDYLDNPLCASCIENYYAACAACTRFVAIDEATAGNETFYCPECNSDSAKQAELNFTDEEVARLVDEFVVLHAEEKRVKGQIETLKQQLKEIAEAQSGGKKPVTLTGSDGASGVKCTYRTSLKADTEKVSELQDCLGQELFSTLFSEKTTFDVNRSNFEKVISADADMPEDVRRQIEAAVKISVSVTLNVA
jgi:hypothetical protein